MMDFPSRPVPDALHPLVIQISSPPSSDRLLVESTAINSFKIFIIGGEIRRGIWFTHQRSCSWTKKMPLRTSRSTRLISVHRRNESSLLRAHPKGHQLPFPIELWDSREDEWLTIVSFAYKIQLTSSFSFQLVPSLSFWIAKHKNQSEKMGDSCWRSQIYDSPLNLEWLLRGPFCHSSFSPKGYRWRATDACLREKRADKRLPHRSYTHQWFVGRRKALCKICDNLRWCIL